MRFALITLCCLCSNWLFSQSLQDSFLVKPYLQFATQNSIYVLWETTAPATATVEYGEALIKAQEPNLSQKVSLEGQRLLHEVKLDGLKTATKYLYRVRSTTASGQEIISPVYTFNTAVQDNDALFFAFIGDTQENSVTPWAWGKVAQRIGEDRPHFIVHAGDVVDVGTRKTDWTEHFFPNGQVVMSRYPMYTVLGNHEQDAQFYYDYMVNPAPEYYYTFKYGNAQFFMIDTNRDVFEGSEQYDWLEWALASSDATWKFVVHHHPPYSSEENDHGNTYIGASTFATQARNLVPLYEAYGVDFCLFGHTHIYERTWPIFNNAVNQKDGVIYINSGGAGGGLEDFDPTRSWFSLEMQKTHHYCTFAIFDHTLVFKAIDHDGKLFDSFQMQKEEAGSSAPGSMMQPPAPHFEIGQKIFQKETWAKLNAFDPSLRIVYTTDGSEPNLQSRIYDNPIVVTESLTLKARAYTRDGRASRVVERVFSKMAPMPALKTGKTQAGLAWKYYQGEWDYLPDFNNLIALKNGVATSVGEQGIFQQDDHFGIVFEGYVELTETATYTFFTRSDDGSKLYIDDKLVVDNDGQHGAFYEYGDIILEKGRHKLRIEYFESSGSQMLQAGTIDAVLGRVPFHPSQLSY